MINNNASKICTAAAIAGVVSGIVVLSTGTINPRNEVGDKVNRYANGIFFIAATINIGCLAIKYGERRGIKHSSTQTPKDSFSQKFK